MHGYTNAIWFAVGMLVLAAVIVVTLVNAGRTDTATVAGSERAPRRSWRSRSSPTDGDRSVVPLREPRTYGEGDAPYVRPQELPWSC